jgi:ribonuclease HII
MSELSLVEFDLAEMGNGGIIGLDEVGRGCLAGPIVVCGCYLDHALIEQNQKLLKTVNDSKKLSDKKRRDLSRKLLDTNIPFLLIYVPASEVDRLNPLRATMEAMWKLASKFQGVAKARDENPWPQALKITRILVDGNERPSPPDDVDEKLPPFKMVVSGDATSAAIACASVVAKVDRDVHMEKLHRRYPEYGFDAHKGYGTAAHNEAVLTHGPCREHRLTFSIGGKKIADLHDGS